MHGIPYPKVRLLSLAAATLLVAAGCGGSDDADGVAGATPTTTVDAPAESESPEEFAEGLVESLEGIQESEGGGSATLDVGDDTWTFDAVLCAFGPDQIGDPDAEFVLSSIQDGLQLYVSVDGFGHSISLNDIEDFENPSIDLFAGGVAAQMSGGSEEFVIVNGKDISATAGFMDGLSDTFDTVEGTLVATCP